jgi:predicted CoA-binding protein
METYKTSIDEFLRQAAVAVIGISSKKQTVANAVYLTLRNGARTVYAVGRNSTAFNNDPCYPDLASLPAPVQGVFAAVRPEHTERIVDDCIALKIPRLWIHHMPGTIDPSAAGISPQTMEKCRSGGVTLIPGACPMMFVEHADFGHRCMKWFLSATGRLK